jgi:hypothetical protein
LSKSLVSSTGRVQPNLSKTSAQRAIRTTRLQQKQTLPMITNKETNAETGQGEEVMVKEHQTQLEQDHSEGKNKPACKNNEITMTLAWTPRTTTVIPTMEEREQSALKKTRSARKKDLLSFFQGGGMCATPIHGRHSDRRSINKKEPKTRSNRHQKKEGQS